MKIELVEAIRKKAQETVNEIHTAMPGLILDIDYNNGTCSVQPYALCETITGEKLKYPVIYKVPIMVPQSSMADTCVAYPILPGDTCLLIVSEGTIDYWLHNRVTDLDSKFDLANAICIPGLMRRFNPCFKEAADDGAVILKYGDGKLKLTNDTLMIRAKNLDIEATGKIEMRAAGNVSIDGNNIGMTGSGNVNVASGGTMTVAGTGNTTLSSGGNLGVNASGNASITGSRVNIN